MTSGGAARLPHASGVDPRRVCFVTGKLAEASLRRTLETMAPSFAYDVVVMKITVAALMTTPWIARFLRVPEGAELVLLPGLCEGDPAVVRDAVGVPVEKGPKDLRSLPEFFGHAAIARDYGAYDIEIAAEINNAPRLSLDAIVREAEYFVAAGADIIDVGCTPGLPFPGLADVVRALRSAGIRVSIDSFDAAEIRTAVDAGAELVLSVNGTNVGVVADIADSGSGARVVAVPDPGGELSSLDRTLEELARHGIPYLIDPVIEPIGMGFARSIARYAEVRRRFPDAELLMGIGNITELTAADSTGINALLVAICEEIGIRTVLTTEVAPWARGCVREIDIARRLMHYAIAERTLPKRVDDRLLTVKDPVVLSYTEAELRELQSKITDSNFRIFADREAITVLSSEHFVRGTDMQAIFDELDVDEAAHAFYLGKELMKARLAITLGKTYRQEGQLSWGYLTPPDDPVRDHVRITQHRRRRDGGAEPPTDAPRADTPVGSGGD